MPPVDRVVVDRAPWATRVAFLAAGDVVEVWVEGADRPSLLGGIALARVTATIPRLGSAIVAIPDGEALLTDRPAVEGERLLVQIVRDAGGGKRAVARAGVELADGWVVLTPAKPGVGLAAAIGGKARRAALKSELEAVIPADIGVLVRSAAADLPHETVVASAAGLLRRWNALEGGAAGLQPPAWAAPPAGLLEAVRAHAPGVAAEVDDSGRLFEACGAADALDAALARRVPLADGGELLVDAAEAATLIDVNLPAGGGREGFRRANEAAGRAALRQMRLRGLRGTVLLDLPRMTDPAARARVLERVREAAAEDPTPVRVLGWTPGGMLEMVREGARRPLADGLLETPDAPRLAPRAAAWAALAGLRREASRIGRPRLLVAPEVARWLDGPGRPSLQAERQRLGHLSVRADPSLTPEEFRVESDD